MTQAVLPYMRETKAGRVITVSSIGGLIGQPFNDAYCAAKFAVEGMMESLAPVVKGMGIHISVVEPGPVLTQFVDNAGGMHQLKQDQLALDPYAKQMSTYLQAVQGRFSQLGQTSEDIARVIVKIAETEHPSFRYQTSDFVRTLVTSKFTDPTGSIQIENTAKTIWKS
jgi:NAD(P)-dependent dehydrogenase (short-subunit alcohol dehydrogenase family)